ncbi:hypothetical protein [Pseudonocardia sp. H11422]|uniref:hypothetical protein n=1 Tax=Pseudonocardia sp. H11422 TaxID=2835866 RepID=UPI001BDC3E9E|nr:hypothetical protein [Pseudonocardia sp. H11422]
MPATDEARARRRLHTRIALMTGVPFAVLYWVLFAGYLLVFDRIDPDPVVFGLLALVSVPTGVLFGVVMSAVLGTVQWRATRARWARRRAMDPDAPATFTPDVRRSRTARIDLPPAEVFRHALQACRALRRAHVTGADEDTTTGGGTITLRVGMSWWSWGERMVVRLRPRDRTATEAEVSSVPVWPPTVVDYGRNEDNVDAVIDWLRALPAPARSRRRGTRACLRSGSPLPWEGVLVIGDR